MQIIININFLKKSVLKALQLYWKLFFKTLIVFEIIRLTWRGSPSVTLNYNDIVIIDVRCGGLISKAHPRSVTGV